MKKVLSIIISATIILSCFAVSTSAFSREDTAPATATVSVDFFQLINSIKTKTELLFRSITEQIVGFLASLNGIMAEEIPNEADFDEPVPDITPVETPVGNEAAPDATVYLSPKKDAVTIDRKGKTTEEYDETCSWYIYGLEEFLTEKILFDEYVEVSGDGYAEVVPVDKNYLPYIGTGTVVNIYDNNSEEAGPVESFTIIIFGDLNGDTIIRAVDATIVDDEVFGNRFCGWSDPDNENYREYWLIAADINKDGMISSVDAVSIDRTVAGASRIDQTTGTLIR